MVAVKNKFEKGIAENLKESKRKIIVFDMKLLIAPFLLLFTLSLSNSYAQDIQIDGKTFQTVKKTVLNTDIEYYLLKEKGKANAKNQAFVKSNGTYNKTIFKETEFKNFIAKGTVSSLGTLVTKTISGKEIMYIDKGSALAFFSIVNKTLNLIEHTGNIEDLFEDALGVKALDDAPGSGGRADCYERCRQAFTGEGCGTSNYDCAYHFFKCRRGCRSRYPSGSGGMEMEQSGEYSISTTTILVK